MVQGIHHSSPHKHKLWSVAQGASIINKDTPVSREIPKVRGYLTKARLHFEQEQILYYILLLPDKALKSIIRSREENISM